MGSFSLSDQEEKALCTMKKKSKYHVVKAKKHIEKRLNVDMMKQ